MLNLTYIFVFNNKCYGFLNGAVTCYVFRQILDHTGCYNELKFKKEDFLTTILSY